jgi:hypothetical protein
MKQGMKQGTKQGIDCRQKRGPLYPDENTQNKNKKKMYRQ